MLGGRIRICYVAAPLWTRRGVNRSEPITRKSGSRPRAMISIIIIFGLMVFLVGAIIVVNPEIIFGLLRNNLEKVSLQVLAIGIRVVIGILLIRYASESKYPTIIEIIGWLSIAAAVIFSIMSRRRFLSLMSWAFSLLKPYGRVGGLFAMAFGGFLVHAFI
jgi:hypothetical protein